MKNLFSAVLLGANKDLQLISMVILRNVLRKTCAFRVLKKKLLLQISPVGVLCGATSVCRFWCVNVLKKKFEWRHNCIKCRGGLVVQGFKEAQDQQASDPLLDLLEWKNASQSFERSPQFYNDYLYRLKKEICMNCNMNTLAYQNMPCGCPFLCSICKYHFQELLREKVGHCCAVCKSTVKDFLKIKGVTTKASPSQFKKKIYAKLKSQKKVIMDAKVKADWAELDKKF